MLNREDSRTAIPQLEKQIEKVADTAIPQLEKQIEKVADDKLNAEGAKLDCTITDSGTALSVTGGADTGDGQLAQAVIDAFDYQTAKEILEV